MSGGTNVCKRNIFTFTPTQVIISGLGLRYIYEVSLASHISKLVGPVGNDQYIYI